MNFYGMAALPLQRDERRDVFSNGENLFFSMVEIFTLLFCVGVFVRGSSSVSKINCPVKIFLFVPSAVFLTKFQHYLTEKYMYLCEAVIWFAKVAKTMKTTCK